MAANNSIMYINLNQYNGMRSVIVRKRVGWLLSGLKAYPTTLGESLGAM